MIIEPGAESFIIPFPNTQNAINIPNPGPGFVSNKKNIKRIIYKEIKLDCGYRIDLLVENSVIVELKAIEAIAPVHPKQLLTYLKVTG